MEPGDVIDGKYRVDRQIGEGGMGQVLAVTHTKLGKKYAIKVVKSAAFQIAGVAERFLREARAASQLRSEHVGEVTDVGELPTGEPYMVMELLEGEDLGNMIDDHGPMRADLAVEYLLQACEALAEAHALGMVHRDIKPANLFLTEGRDNTQIVKVLDFGIATAAHGEVSGLTETHSVMGSPQYMSPEQLRSAKIVDARSDIWSLGVTLYELVSQRQPFDGTTFTALAIKIATEAHEPLTEVSAELAAIVDRCLMKDPAKRFADIVEFAYALATLVPDGRRAAARVERALRPGSAPVISNAAIVTLPARPSSPVSPHAASTLRDPMVPELHATTLGGSAASFVSVPARAGRGRAIAAGVLVVGAAIGVIVVRRMSSDAPAAVLPVASPVVTAPATPPVAVTPPAVTPPVAVTPPPSTPASSRIEIRTMPADAELVLDDAAVTNPFTRSVERTDARHHLEVRARGFQPRSEWITFETDRSLVVTLDKDAATKVVSPKSNITPTPTPTPTPRPTEIGAGSGKATYKGTQGSIITDYPTSP